VKGYNDRVNRYGSKGSGLKLEARHDHLGYIKVELDYDGKYWITVDSFVSGQNMSLLGTLPKEPTKPFIRMKGKQEP